MASEKIYDYEFEGEIEYPVQMDVNITSVPGFELRDSAGNLLELNSSGYYTINEPPSIYINENVQASTSEYSFSSAIVKAYADGNIFRSDGDASKGHSFGGQADLLMVGHEAGPFKILNDSFDMVSNLVGNLEVSFVNIDLCPGGCDKESNFTTYDEDGFNKIQNVYRLDRQTPMGINQNEIVWEYTGFSKTYDDAEATPH